MNTATEFMVEDQEQEEEAYYFYEFKHGMHCICKAQGVEYLGVKATAETKQEAIELIDKMNS